MEWCSLQWRLYRDQRTWSEGDSLKHPTREKRRQGKDPIQYQIADDAYAFWTMKL